MSEWIIGVGIIVVVVVAVVVHLYLKHKADRIDSEGEE